MCCIVQHDCTPLHFAAGAGLVDVATLLLNCGASVNISDKVQSLHIVAKLCLFVTAGYKMGAIIDSIRIKSIKRV